LLVLYRDVRERHPGSDIKDKAGVFRLVGRSVTRAFAALMPGVRGVGPGPSAPVRSSAATGTRGR